MDNKIMHEGVLDLAGLEIPCYVLEDGTRVLSGRGLQGALHLVDNNESAKTSGSRLNRYLNQKSLEPFIYGNIEPGHFDPIICYNGEKKINGFEATILVDICDSFLEARKNIKLSSRQEKIAEQCEILMRSFAKVGITALVDEATGYQYNRERFELQKILKTYIADEILKWQLTFTDEFYREVYRLWKLPFIPKYIKRKPSFIGKLTTKYVYDMLPDGVIEKIREVTPKTKKGYWKYKFHQSLTEEVGREHLKKQIIETTMIMKMSKTKEEFIKKFNEMYGKVVQLEMEFEDEEEEKQEKLSKHNKSLKQALEFNPNEKQKKNVQPPLF